MGYKMSWKIWQPKHQRGIAVLVKLREERGFSELSTQCILHGMLDLYPNKIQALHHLLLADTGARQNFATWELAQMEYNSQWLLNVM